MGLIEYFMDLIRIFVLGFFLNFLSVIGFFYLATSFPMNQIPSDFEKTKKTR